MLLRLRTWSRSVLIASAAGGLVLAQGCSGCEAGNETTGGFGGDGAGGPGGPGVGGAGGSTGSFEATSSTGTSMQPSCKVSETDLDALPPCRETAPADAFDPVVKWSFSPPGGAAFTGSLTTPLVGNFTDDNADGDIDLCDIPDVLVLAFTAGAGAYEGIIYILSGDDGSLKGQSALPVDGNINPAFGDLDGDGLPEIIAATSTGNVIIFEHDGTHKLTGAKGTWPTISGPFGGNLGAYCHAFAVYDLDADGTPEILGGFDVFDNVGQLKWSGTGTLNDIPGEPFWCPAPAAADLDDDGKLEVLHGHAAYHHDGQLMWQVPGNPGQPHVANLDDDPEPEVLVNSDQGISVIEHNGTVKFGPTRPTGEAASARCWGKPVAIHDFDGNGTADLGVGTCTTYAVYDITTTVEPNWTTPVSDFSGLATGTAFDFLGDGVADAIYADEQNAYVWEGVTGAIELQVSRTSGTLIEYPVVADVDNDGSAEFVVVSNGSPDGVALTVYRDSQDRWIPARRIWNQHSYHVTNVREDGTIPKDMKKSWTLLNTFRTNSQVEAGGDCEPEQPR